MARPERPIEADGGPLSLFAQRLRRLRADAGSPTYRRLSERTHFAASVLSAATRGAQLPTWAVTRAFVLACGGKEDEWREAWREVSEALRPPTVPAAGARAAVRTLPAATAAFTGRAAELARIVALAERARSESAAGTVVISAIGGMAGVGKTALALRAGHLLAERFPHGQLFIDLHGYTQGIAPREPADALAVFLRSLGLAPGQIPPDLDARAALYRDRLSETRTLIVLDNAASEAQVRALLPGGGGCLVLVTSRKRLRGLDDAHAVALDVLPAAEAVTLLRQVAGLGAAEADDALLREIAGLCGHLPLALRISAALIRHRPTWTLRDLADKLREDGTGLGGFFDGDRDLAGLFDLSYRTLTERHRLLFRRLGLVPGPDLDARAAAVLIGDRDGGGTSGAQRLMQDLVDHNLVEEPTADRYRLHDLVRLHARALALADPADERAAAMERLLEYYARTASRADARIARYARPGRADDPAPAFAPELSDASRSRQWLRAERANLLACIGYATAEARDEYIIVLTAGLSALLRAEGPRSDALALHTAAAAAAQRLGDRLGYANALIDLGAVRYMTDDFPGATRDLESAAQLYRDLGDRLGPANAATERGVVRRVTGDPAGALRDFEEALLAYRARGDRGGQAGTLVDSGMARYLTGDLPGALRDLEEAALLYRGLGDAVGLANAASMLGGVRQSAGDLAAARRDLEEAVELHASLGNRAGQAGAHIELGAVLRLTGDLPGAVRMVDEGLQAYRELGNRLGQTIALCSRATVSESAGDLPGAVRDYEEALELCRRIGARSNEAWVLNRYAAVVAAEDPARALAMHEEALPLARAAGAPPEEALALEGIGECRLREGRGAEGVAQLTEALAIFRRLGMPEAERVGRRLAQIDEPLPESAR